MKNNVTINAVAREAGVSISTVSRVLNGTARVAPEKQFKVENAMLKLGYRTQLVASHRTSSKLKSIGVMLQDLTSTYYTHAISGIEQALQDTGHYPVFISGHWNPATEQEALEILLDRQVAGLIVIGGYLSEDHLRTLTRQIPLVILDRLVKGLEKHCIPMNNTLGAYMATKHLLDLGHRQIAHVAGMAGNQDSIERLAGYRQALTDAGVPYDAHLVIQGDFRELSGILAVEILLSRSVQFSAIFCANDQMAYGVRLALFRKGIRVPQDISLVGFDDIAGSDYITPPLTTIKHPIYEMGFAAGKGLLKVLNQQPFPSFPDFPPSLVVRESTTMLFKPRYQPQKRFDF
ncbi:LacI family DNA-binding transcriptional regulator [Deinococcus roseus]|uniref:LacI family transcriptional regulator n=1 Tax=Deinococcus roseus TaxID=392414 RepID=A0ABQ2D608_9DEIO|nr:substrate-binding domain-containing protein [Deinococcus roseus]GGJ45104.1 LacI family transcriptional regulator [Deinococcus roseus]